MFEITTNDAVVVIEQLPSNANKITVKPFKNDFFIPIKSLETRYSVKLIEKILAVKGADYLCDEIARDEDENYVKKDIETDLKSYFPHEDFAEKIILDFGCGSGSSSMVLARMFPKAKIVGVELEEKHLSIARARLEFYGYENIEFHRSPSGSELPANVGEVDLVIMSAVYEHLLPAERRSVMPLVWSKIKTGGFLFLNMTPHRFFPVEHHTTGLPLINYLPKSLTYFAARRFSKRLDPTEAWETYLRRGIRGGTENEILKILNADTKNAALIEPAAENIKDRIDLWFSQLNQDKMRAIKKSIKLSMKSLKFLTGIVLVPNLSLVFQKNSKNIPN
ncbi:MAG TPA: class I SAM-dependent methyltransferase [Pyrinomonadaceae bacterium]|nr:class I SAM-dependent methyltransferase [Pyrinomonadaceae bacterium]